MSTCYSEDKTQARLALHVTAMQVHLTVGVGGVDVAHERERNGLAEVDDLPLGCGGGDRSADSLLAVGERLERQRRASRYRVPGLDALVAGCTLRRVLPS